jgi:superfamily II DNA/RNA helicase
MHVGDRGYDIHKKPDILVGTPGRLAELMIGTTGSDIGGSNMKRGGRVPINNVQSIVLDEFDALLSYTPHSDPTQALMEFMKRNRGNDIQTVMCSATASDMMIQQMNGGLLEEKHLRPGYVFAVADADDILVTALNSEMDANRNVTRTTRVSRTVMHGVVHVPHKRFALDTLRRILHTEPMPQQILIFVSDSRKVGIVVEKLADVGIIAAPLHGGMDSEKMDRAEVSRALREGYVGIVVSTEMAARGLDAPLLTHVINMDLPTDSSHYAHRAGRCGRGGRPGVVINLTTSPQERGVPIKLADQLGVKMYTVEVKSSKLNVIDPQSQILDGS